MWGNPVFDARAANTWPVNFNVSRCAPLVGRAWPGLLKQFVQAPLLGASCLSLRRDKPADLHLGPCKRPVFVSLERRAALRNESGG